MASISKLIENGIVRTSRALSILVLVASLQVFMELVLRYFFNRPTLWGLELSTYLCGASYILSGGYASLLEAHIRIDLIYGKVSKRGKALIDLILVFPLLMVTLGSLIWRSSVWLKEAVADKLTSGTAWDPPLWPMRLTILVGILLLMVAEINNIARGVNALKVRED
ncbi:MAG: TRAP transporter small permease subunit [Candidatus Jordarchaeaceae archaeon]